MLNNHRIIHSDNRAAIPRLPRKCIDLVLTSPPYAMKRRKHYSSISESDYPSWCCGWMGALVPVLKPSASVAVVIRSHVRGGSVSPYILETRLALREAGWIEPEELIWIKPDSAPVAPNHRPRRSWEQILWFARSEHFRSVYCDPTANGKPNGRIGSVGSRRYQDLFVKPRNEIPGASRSRDYVEVPVSKNSRGNPHPAQFPVPLAAWVIRLLCPPDGLVLDPFGGSGSTSVAAYLENRRSISIERELEYVSEARRRLHFVQQSVTG